MAALERGTTAPDFTLPAMDGKQFSLREALARGPVLAAFFKISCPTCQYAFPFLQRIYEAHGNKAVTIVGISQNTKKDTAAFIKEYGITFPVLLDDTNSYPVSNAYGLTNVPTIFWIAGDGEIEISSVGWVKKEMEEFNQRAQNPGRWREPLFHNERTGRRLPRRLRFEKLARGRGLKSGVGRRTSGVGPRTFPAERSRTIREANRPAESKDPYAFNEAMRWNFLCRDWLQQQWSRAL